MRPLLHSIAAGGAINVGDEATKETCLLQSWRFCVSGNFYSFLLTFPALGSQYQ